MRAQGLARQGPAELRCLHTQYHVSLADVASGAKSLEALPL